MKNKKLAAYMLLVLSFGYLFLASFSQVGENFPQLMWIMGLFAGVGMFQLKQNK